MSESNDPLESELTNMRPRAFSEELAGRIESTIAAGAAWSWADRLLIGAMSAGSVAACVIVGMVMMSAGPPRPEFHAAAASAKVPTIGSYIQDLASADNHWTDAAN